MDTDWFSRGHKQPHQTFRPTATACSNTLPSPPRLSCASNDHCSSQSCSPHTFPGPNLSRFPLSSSPNPTHARSCSTCSLAQIPFGRLLMEHVRERCVLLRACWRVRPSRALLADLWQQCIPPALAPPPPAHVSASASSVASEEASVASEEASEDPLGGIKGSRSASMSSQTPCTPSWRPSQTAYAPPAAAIVCAVEDAGGGVQGALAEGGEEEGDAYKMQGVRTESGEQDMASLVTTYARTVTIVCDGQAASRTPNP